MFFMLYYKLVYKNIEADIWQKKLRTFEEHAQPILCQDKNNKRNLKRTRQKRNTLSRKTLVYILY